jgi:ketosteroid isomerase-like protein
MKAARRVAVSALTDVRDRHYEGVSKVDLELGASVLAPDVENMFPGAPPGSANGVDGWKAFAGPMFKAIPEGVEIQILTTAESGDTLFTEAVLRATHTGPLETPQGTIAPTGGRLEIPCVDVFKIRDGKTVSHHLYFDQATLMAQLGVVSQPAGYTRLVRPHTVVPASAA